MNRMIASCATALFVFAAGTAFAQTDPQLVLVSGSDVIEWNGTSLICTGGTGGTGACATTDFSTGVTYSTAWGILAATNASGSNLTLIAQTFAGWDVTSDAGSSNSPSCNPDCMSQNSLNANDGTGNNNLQAFFGSAFYNYEPGLVNLQEVSENDGGFTSTDYYNQSSSGLAPLGYCNEVTPAACAPTLSSWTSFGTMTFANGNTTPQTNFLTPTDPPSGEFALTSSYNFTAAAGASFTVTDTITATPEPTSIILFGGVALVAFEAIRRKLRVA